MAILDPVKPSILAVRIISNVDRGFAEKLGLTSDQRALGLITCDIDVGANVVRCTRWRLT